MPFQSEKQRRFLWAAHPDIAKRWAHEYPKQRNLPTYAHDKKKTSEKQESPKEKEAAMARNVTTQCDDYRNTVVNYVQALIYKHANSAAVPVEIPHSEQPVSAGEEHVSCKGPDQEGQLLGQLSKEERKPPVNETLHKLAVVLSQVLQQQIADEQAAQQGQEAQPVPQNVNMKQYAQPASATPLPMGMAQAQSQQMQAAMPGAAPQAQAPQAPAAPQKTAELSWGGRNWAYTPKGSPLGVNAGYTYLGGLIPMPYMGLDVGNKDFGFRLGDGLDHEQRSLTGVRMGGSRNTGWGGVENMPPSLWKLLGKLMHSKDTPAAPQKTANVAPMPAVPQATAAPTPAPVGGKGGLKPIKPITPKSSPNFNPIQAYSGLSSSGVIDGNASLGVKKTASSPAWQRSAGKNDEGGLNEKGRKSYEREHGGNLKAPVTEKNPKGKAKARQNSFCSRMCGMKRVNTGASTAKDPDSRINKSLRKWNCKCSAAMQFGVYMGRIG
jgi:hypothetical protein